MAELKSYPFEHFNLNEPKILLEATFKLQQKYCAECVDMKERAIVEAVIRLAKEAGVTELFLLDRQFVLDALTDALRKWGENNG